MYSNEDSGGVAIPLVNYLPVVNGNTKIVSVIGWCTDGPSVTVPRTFLTNAATGVTEADNVSTQDVRRANLGPAAGAEAPNPQPAPVSSSQCEIARIVLGQSGIVSITYVTANQMPNVTDLESRVTALEAFEAQAGSQIATLGSDLANLANAIIGLPSPAIFTQIVEELSQLAALAKLPQTAVNFHTDYLLSLADSSSDTSNANFYCNVQEGIRFPWAAQQLGILQLNNPIDPNVQPGSGTGIMLPAYTQVPRISVLGNSGSYPITYQYQNTVATQKTLSRQVLNFGKSFTVCTNSVWWGKGTYDPTTGIFTRNGETYTASNAGADPAGPAYSAYHLERLTQCWTSTMTSSYTSYKTVNVPVSGSCLYQTFLNSQPGWLTSFDIAFTSVASQGGVQLLLCGTTNGLPDFTQVLSSVTLPVTSLNTYPATTNFPLQATYLDAGSRYALVLATPGNHSVAYVANNKYAQGACGYADSTGGWTQPINVTQDLAFQANFAKFTSTICQVQMSSTPFQLQGGMTDISLLYGSQIPDGCQLVWEFQVNGVWYPMQSYATGAQTNPLLGLPPLVPVRVTYIGTTDLMPAIDMTQTQTLVSRPANRFTHVSLPISIGVSSSTISVQVVVDAFDPANHTVGCALIVGGQTVQPSVTSAAVQDTDDPTRYTTDYVFSLSSPTTTFAIEINGTTTAVTEVFHVESRFDYET